MQQLHGLEFVKSRPWKALTLSLCAMGAVPYAAHAKWKAAYIDALKDVAAWYTVQQNGEGESCCDKADGHPFYGDYLLDANGDVEFDSSGTHYHLPAYMVLKGPNPTGHAGWWYDVEVDSRHIDLCFAPGPTG